MAIRDAACSCRQLRLKAVGNPFVVSMCHSLACERSDRKRTRGKPVKKATRCGAEGSVSGSGTTRAPQAQHVRQAWADDRNRPPEAAEPGGIWQRRE